MDVLIAGKSDHTAGGIRLWTALVLLIPVCLFGQATADDAVAFDYDIFRCADTVAVWLDLTPLLNQRRMEDLVSGLEIRITIDARLEAPRWPWPARTLTVRRLVLALTRRLQEDVYTLTGAGVGPLKYEFPSQLEVADFLADSVVVPLVAGPFDQAASKLRVNLSIACKSLQPNSFSGTSVSVPPLQPKNGLFEQLFSFLSDMVGFGEESYQIVSPTFRLEELAAPR